MDGVVAHWFDGFANLFNLTDEEHEELREFYIKNQYVEDCPVRPRAEWEKWKELSNRDNGQFWADLSPLPWAKRLYDYFNDLEIVEEVAFLTSPGRDYTLCWERKREWLEKHIGTNNVVITTNKYHCARKGAVLVDDTLKHIKQFEEHGGKGILWPNPFTIIDSEDKGYLAYSKYADGYDGSVIQKETKNFDSFLEQMLLLDVLTAYASVNGDEIHASRSKEINFDDI